MKHAPSDSGLGVDRRLRWVSAGLALVVACLGSVAFGDEACCKASVTDASRPEGFKRSVATYDIPDLSLIDQNGQEVNLVSILEPPKPVALNFIFTTCTTICPVMTATFSRLQDALGEDADTLRMVSISLDPEYDTPKVLRSYAEKFRVGGDWHFLTGDSEDIDSVLRAFNALTGSKMSHTPFTLFKLPDHEDWVRIDGLIGGAALADEYRLLLAN
jgi:protein SCO1/2